MAQLSNIRETRFNFIARDKAPGLTESPTLIKVRFDNWRKVEHYEMVNEFTGITIFRSLGDYPDQIHRDGTQLRCSQTRGTQSSS